SCHNFTLSFPRFLRKRHHRTARAATSHYARTLPSCVARLKCGADSSCGGNGRKPETRTSSIFGLSMSKFLYLLCCVFHSIRLITTIHHGVEFLQIKNLCGF